MSQRLIQPGLSAAGKYHPRTALPVEPIGEINGRLIWPAIGGDESDDPDDPRFQDGGGDDDEDDADDEDDDTEDDDEDDEDEDDKKSKSKKDKSKKSKDDDEDDDSKPVYTEDEMHAVKRRMRKADQRASKAEARIAELERQLAKKPKTKTGSDDTDDKGGVDNEELRTLRERNAKLEAERQQTRIEKAFSRVPLPEGEEWVDLEDAVAAAQRLGLLEDVLDEDGTVDRRSLRAALRELKRRKPHLVRKVSDPDENEDEEDDEDQRSKKRRTASKMNGKRKGQTKSKSKDELAKRFPVLGR